MTLDVLQVLEDIFFFGILTTVEAHQDHLELQNVTQIKRRRKCWKKISKNCDVLIFPTESRKIRKSANHLF